LCWMTARRFTESETVRAPSLDGTAAPHQA
jgi:hypothetical protein